MRKIRGLMLWLARDGFEVGTPLTPEDLADEGLMMVLVRDLVARLEEDP